MSKHFRPLAWCGVFAAISCWSALAAADNGAPAETNAQTPQTRPALTDIPHSVKSADPRIAESMTIETSKLLGFTTKDVEKIAQEHLAAVLGPAQITVSEATKGAHPASSGFGDYTIGPGDELEFVSFNETTLSRPTVVVRYDGFVSLPRVKDVKVAGLTRDDAEKAIGKAYGAIYKDPEVSLSVVRAQSKTYTVTGDVQTPGRYPYSQETSLWDAISLAGGLRQRNTSSSNGGGFVGVTGQITKAFIIRRIDGERKVLPFDLRGLGKPGDYQGDTPIFYGDIVYVPEGVNLVYLLGESRNPVIVELTEGMTLMQMLALSGGYNTSTAKISSIVLLRASGENTTDVHRIDLRMLLKGKAPDLPLQPGDIIYLPRKSLVRIEEFVQRFTGSISPILGLYTQAIDASYALDISRETLNALENSNVTVGTRTAAPQGILRLPRVIGGAPATPPAPTR